MSTQLDQAYALINQLKARFPELSDIHEKLRVIVADAQNGPPDGKADGSIDETTWKQLQGTDEALGTLLMTLLFHGKSEQHQSTLSDDEIDELLGLVERPANRLVGVDEGRQGGKLGPLR